MVAFSGELTLNDELREQLELGPSESARLLLAEGRTLVLERVKETTGIAVPWDRDLVLNASVQAFPLADVLSMLHGAGKSGFLLFGSGDHEKAVYLHRGEVVFASSNQDVDRLGECLFRGSVITLDQLHDAEERWSPTNRIGKVLVERGHLSPRELWNGVRYQVEEIVRSLFAYTDGSVHFWEGEVQPDNVVRLSLPTRRLISEGLKRRDELLRFLAALEDPNVRIRLVGGVDMSLRGTPLAVYESLEGEAEFGSICRNAGVDPLSGARSIQLLRLAGAVEVTRASEADPLVDGSSTKKDEQATLRDLVVEHISLICELLAPLVATDGPAAVRSRIESLIEEGAANHSGLLKGLNLGGAGELDPEEIVHRALRFTGDRDRVVRSSLGEIVSYLEFELRNHPQIDDPDIYLEALEDLRAKLDH